MFKHMIKTNCSISEPRVLIRDLLRISENQNHTHATMKQLRFEGIDGDAIDLGEDAKDEDDQTMAPPTNAKDDREIPNNAIDLGEDAKDEDDQTMAPLTNAKDDREIPNIDYCGSIRDTTSLEDDNRTIAPQANATDNQPYPLETDDFDDMSALSNATGGTRMPSTTTLQNLRLSSDFEESNETTRTNHPQSDDTPRQDSNNESTDGVSG